MSRQSVDDPSRPQRPPTVGVFDSGVGGLSVVQALRQRAPSARVIYLADAHYAPYGPRPPEWLRERSIQIAAALGTEGATALVMACNTLTAAAADHLRQQSSLPVIGMEPAIKPAARATRSGTVAVFATDGTLASQRFAGLLERHTGDTRVLVEPCGDLVAFAEAGHWDGPDVTEAARHHLETVIEAGADTVVLGCTHFPLLRPLLGQLAAGRVHIIDTGNAVARQIVARTGVTADTVPTTPPALELLTTGDPEHLNRIAGRLFTGSTPARSLRLDQATAGAPTDDPP